MQIKAFFELIRPLNCLMAAFGVFVGYFIAFSGAGIVFSETQLIIAMLAAFFVCAAGQTINDVFDSEIDARIRPKKPIPSKRITKDSAFWYSIGLFAIGNILALFLMPASIVISISFTVLLIVYSAKMQKTKFLGNWIVGLGTAFTLVFGATIIGNYNIVLFLAAAALLANVAREIIKDTEDIDADKGLKVSLPMVAGKQFAKAFVFALYIVAIILPLFVFFALKFGNILFLVFAIVSAAIFLYSGKMFFDGKNDKAQLFSKIGMLIALIGFFAGAF
ncbi:MAG: UbiA family prenyltransferase [Candidatus ainarchaeum sp.]|nr:UbiA family prenyltransferase [Candidatus ainarchaeum sp.]